MRTEMSIHADLSKANESARLAMIETERKAQLARLAIAKIGDLDVLTQKLKAIRNGYAGLNRVNSRVP